VFGVEEQYYHYFAGCIRLVTVINTLYDTVFLNMYIFTHVYMFNSFSSLGSPWLAAKTFAAPAPSPPTDFTVDTGASYATLNFTPPAGATSYTVTATPTTNTYEIVVTSTFSSGSGYKLEVLSSKTTYTFSLIATNSSGSSTAATASATTKTGTISASPTITYTKVTQNFSLTGSAFVYTYIACPKTTPNIIYVATFEGTPTIKLYYSNNGGTTFTDISTRLKWNPNTAADQYGAGLCCSDDGRYVYMQPYYRYLNVSTNYGVTFNFSKSPSSNNTAHTGVTSPGGEIIMVAGGGESGYGTTSNVIHWSNNSNSTYKYRTVSNSNNPNAVDFSNNVVYYADGSTLRSYNAGSKANLLSFDFSAVTFASTTTLGGTALSTIGKMASKGGITVIGCANAPKIRLSTDGGATFTNVTYFNSGAGNVVTMNLQSTITIEPYVGFIMVHDRDTVSKFFYSVDRGTTWAQYVPSPAIANASASSCVLKDTNLIVNIVSSTDLHTFTIPVTVA
jgi:hypothetical protein